MLREDKADTYKPTINNTIRTILVDDVSFNDIFSNKADKTCHVFIFFVKFFTIVFI